MFPTPSEVSVVLRRERSAVPNVAEGMNKMWAGVCY